MNTTSTNNAGNTVDNTDRRSREKSACSDLSNKVRGAAEVIHGVGENIRGTTLGAVDTLSKDETTKNDETAQKGRLETERGLTKLRGGQPPSHVQSASTNPTRSTYGNHSSTNPGATGSNQAGEQGGMPASTDSGSGVGFQGNPRTIHGGPRRDPNDMMGQTRASDGTGTQYPLGAGADPSAATRPTTATQTGRQPDSNYQHLGNTNAYGPATVEMGGPESTTYPSHHREDAVGRMPERQLRAVQQTAYVHPYNTAQDPSSGPDLKQSQQAYENRSYKPSSGSDIYPPQN